MKPGPRRKENRLIFRGGGGWIRTSVGVSQQIYSLPPLATRAPLRDEPVTISLFSSAADLPAVDAVDCRSGATLSHEAPAEVGQGGAWFRRGRPTGASDPSPG